MDQATFDSQYLGSFHATTEGKYLYDLAKEYHDICEIYDRAICTGPMGRDGIMPANGREMGMITRHAIQVLHTQQRKAMQEKQIPFDVTKKAIQNYRHK